MAYIAVDDIDKRLRKAAQVGAKVMKEPFDVPGVGRDRDPFRARRCGHRLDDACLMNQLEIGPAVLAPPLPSSQ
jgi:hypothetical protein